MPPEQTPEQNRPSTSFNFLETDPKKNFAPWFLIFCGVLIAIGLGIAGYFKYQAYENYKQGLLVAEQLQEQGVATSTWQTYRNEEYGFEFKYPNDWAPGNLYGLGSGILLQLRKDYTNPGYRNPESFQGLCHMNFIILSNERSQNESIKSWYNREQDTNNSGVISTSTIMIGGKESINSIGEEMQYVNYYYIPTRETEILSASLTCGGDILEDGTQIFNQILSTFKFIEQATTSKSTSTINTVKTLPPDPGEAGKQTLQGIDSDKDGVRDDVQIWIAINYSNYPLHIKALRQAAIATQKVFTANNEATRKSVLAEELAGVRCLVFLKGTSDKSSDLLDEMIFNTPARIAAHDVFSKNLKSEWFDSPGFNELEKYCNFDTNKTQ